MQAAATASTRRRVLEKCSPVPRCRCQQNFLSSRSSSTASNGPSVQAAPVGGANGSGSSIGGASSSSSSSSKASSSSSPLSSPSASASSPLPPNAALAKKRNTDLALIVSGTLGLSALLFYNLRNTSKSENASASTVGKLAPFSTSASPYTNKTFTLPINTSSGTQLKTLEMFTPAKVDEILRQHERSYSVTRPGNPLIRYDTSTVASNDPSEDAHSFTILEHEGKDFVVASIFDGHAGGQTSKLMSTELEKYVARELFDALKGGKGSSYHGLAIQGSISKQTWWDWIYSAGGANPTPPKHGEPNLFPSANLKLSFSQRTALIPEALRNAYKLADRDLISAPMQLLREYTSPSSPSTAVINNSNAPIPDLTEQQRLTGLSALLPALSGSCALTTVLDTEQNNLYVALSGDSRAVMGSFDEKSGKWRQEVLSEDQTGRNLKEVERMRKEHPKSEHDTVISRGRVLGGLEPTRSLGDAKYKWPVGVQERLIQVFRPRTSRTAPPHLYKTPPYVTADPVVGSFPLTVDQSASGGSIAHEQSNQETNFSPIGTQPVKPRAQETSTAIGRRFLVLATDGLYDRLSNEEVVSLVGSWLDGQKDPLTKQELFSTLAKEDKGLSAAMDGTHKPPKQDKEFDGDKRYVFTDDNLGTHLIRNSLGGHHAEQVSALLSIPAPHSRRYRDDTTVVVLVLGDHKDSKNTRLKVEDEDLAGMKGVTRAIQGSHSSRTAYGKAKL